MVQDIFSMNPPTLFKMLKMCGAKLEAKEELTIIKLAPKEEIMSIPQEILNKNIEYTNGIQENRKHPLNDEVSL